jgi:acetolactate synthase-1/2/3 large subunit
MFATRWLEMTNAEAIARTLAEEGVELAFGLPGGEVVLLIEACRKAGIRFLLTGHEASAAFMADVTGQITGRAGVCIATLGPGAVNLSLGLANAFLDRSPVLAITGSIPSAIESHFPHQRLSLKDVFGPICKESLLADGVGTAELAAHCLRLAATPRWGPVHLALPSDLAGAPATDGTPRAVTGVSEGSTANPLLDEIGELVNEAERPLLIAGLGCTRGDIPMLRRLVDHTRIPFLVTPKAKGVLPEDAPGFLGVVGGMAIDNAVMSTLEYADAILGVGFDPVECDKPWYAGRRIASLSRASTAEGAYRPVEHIGAIDEGLRALQTRISPREWAPDLLKECRARLRVSALADGGYVSPVEVVQTLRELLPRDGVLTCDVGSHKYFAGQFWQAYEPQTFFMSNGLSAMGYGIPAAIAAKLQFPRRPTVALVGDGGFLMMLHNLVFLRQYGVPVVIVCLVDHSLSLIRIGQQRRGLEPYGVDFPAPDFAAIAAGFGVQSWRAESIGDVRRTVGAAVEGSVPAVIHVPVSMREYEAYA